MSRAVGMESDGNGGWLPPIAFGDPFAPGVVPALPPAPRPTDQVTPSDTASSGPEWREGLFVGGSIPIAYGRVRVVPPVVRIRQGIGSIRTSVYHTADFGVVLSEGPIDAIESWHTYDGKTVGATVDPAQEFAQFDSRLGTLSQTAIGFAEMGPLFGVAHAATRGRAGRATYPCMTIRGRVTYDPRLGAWGSGEYPEPSSCAWNANPILEVADLLTNPHYGPRIPPGSINWPSFAAAADACDAIVDGEKAWECHLYLREKRSVREWIDTILLHCGGVLGESNGVWSIRCEGVRTTPDATLTDDDMVPGTTQRVSDSTGAGMADVPNRVTVEWTDPTTWTLRTVSVASADVDAGAAVREGDPYKLHGLQSEKAAQRAATRILGLARSNRVLECTVWPKHVGLGVGAFLSITSDRLGLIDSKWVVTDVAEAKDGALAITAKEYDASAFSATGTGDPLPGNGFFDTPPPLVAFDFSPTPDESQTSTPTSITTTSYLTPRWKLPAVDHLRRVRVRYGALLPPRAVGSITVAYGGSGYSADDPITVYSGDGTGMVARVATVGVGGAIETVEVTNGGSGYTSEPSVEAAGGGFGAVLAAHLAPAAWSDLASLSEAILPLWGEPARTDGDWMSASLRPFPSKVTEETYDSLGVLIGTSINGGGHYASAVVESLAGLLSDPVDCTTLPHASADLSEPTHVPLVHAKQAAPLSANAIPKRGAGADTLVNSKLADDGASLTYDGNAVYHEGNPPPAGDTFPAGAIVAYGGSAAPGGWLLCDGSAVSRTTYADLFAVLGTTHGAGDGSTTFNLPNLRDRFVRGKGASSAIGDTGGAATHLHAVGLSVGTSGTNARETGDTLTPDASPVSGHLTVDHYHSSSVAGDTGSASSLPPYLVEVYIVKASGTPSAATPHNTLASRDASGAHPASAVSFTPTGSISATTVQAAIEEVAAEAGGGGSPLTVKEEDGSPSVANVTELRFSGATVTDNGAGAVTVTVTSGGGATSPASALYLHSTFGGF